MRTVLVTGASSGFGRHFAQMLAGEGWRSFDPAADPYRPTEAEIARMRTPYQS